MAKKAKAAVAAEIEAESVAAAAQLRIHRRLAVAVLSVPMYLIDYAAWRFGRLGPPEPTEVTARASDMIDEAVAVLENPDDYESEDETRTPPAAPRERRSR